MTDPIREAAIEAAAKAMSDDWNPEKYPVLTAMFRDYAQSAVDAVLAVAGPAYRAEALRDAADDWPEWAKLTDENDRQSLHGHRQVFQSWLRDRADAEEGA